MKFTVRFLILTVFFASLSTFSSLYGASPSGDRGGELSAAEKAQQKLLRQLRRDIAIHRILSRQASTPVSTQAPKVAKATTITPLKTTAISESTDGKTCSNTVDNCFLKLESLFQDHFGEEFQLTKSLENEDQPLTQAGI
jgi:hypothetical protein